MIQAIRPIFRMSVIAVAFAMLAGCGHMPTMHWPWSAKPPPPLPRADELLVTLGESTTVASYPQYWKRNTLLIDLRGIKGSGSVAMRPRTGTQWPVRLAFRLSPGDVSSIEVVGDQRAILPITADGIRAVELELAPGIYTPKTEQLVVRLDSGAVRQSAAD